MRDGNEQRRGGSGGVPGRGVIRHPSVQRWLPGDSQRVNHSAGSRMIGCGSDGGIARQLMGS
ncbi:MAG: hypothetical protein ACK583_02310 [Cyanobacteriota bacterium]